MKVLSLHQPWATLVALGVKTIETRSWPAPDSVIGQRIAIHAAKRFDRDGWEAQLPGLSLPGLAAAEWLLLASPKIAQRGVVVATAVVTDCIPILVDNDARLVSGATGTDNFGVFQRYDVLWLDRAGPDGNLDITHQLTFGDFTPGRWAWLLDDVQPLDPPQPARGRQRLWNWEPDNG